MKRKIKKILGLTDRLIKLMDEHTDIFFEERKFLENPETPLIIEPQDERRNENELKIKKTTEATNEEVDKEVPVETFDPKQEGLL